MWHGVLLRYCVCDFIVSQVTAGTRSAALRVGGGAQEDSSPLIPRKHADSAPRSLGSSLLFDGGVDACLVGARELTRPLGDRRRHCCERLVGYLMGARDRLVPGCGRSSRQRSSGDHSGSGRRGADEGMRLRMGALKRSDRRLCRRRRVLHLRTRMTRSMHHTPHIPAPPTNHLTRPGGRLRRAPVCGRAHQRRWRLIACWEAKPTAVSALQPADASHLPQSSHSAASWRAWVLLVLLVCWCGW